MSLLKEMSKYILRNIHWFALSTAITIVTTFINIYIPTLSGQAVKDILSIGDFEMLKGLVIQILVLTGGLCLFSLIRSSAYGYFTQKVVFDVRNDVFRSIQRQSFGFFDKMKTGQLMSRATTDVERIRGFVGFQTSNAYRLPFSARSRHNVNGYHKYGSFIISILHCSRSFFRQHLVWEKD